MSPGNFHLNYKGRWLDVWYRARGSRPERGHDKELQGLHKQYNQARPPPPLRLSPLYLFLSHSSNCSPPSWKSKVKQEKSNEGYNAGSWRGGDGATRWRCCGSASFSTPSGFFNCCLVSTGSGLCHHVNTGRLWKYSMIPVPWHYSQLLDY